jgi:hypothetical protein
MYRSIMAVKVSRVLSGTSTKKQLPDSRSMPPKTQCPSRHWPCGTCGEKISIHQFPPFLTGNFHRDHL